MSFSTGPVGDCRGQLCLVGDGQVSKHTQRSSIAESCSGLNYVPFETISMRVSSPFSTIQVVLLLPGQL